MTMPKCLRCGGGFLECLCIPLRKTESSESAVTGCSATDILKKLKTRIEKAGEKGKGCRITAEECDLLRYYNLPCTAEGLEVMDGE
ncbi:MAG: hypothetical protein KAS32_26640 [Candidatus Peribacteraceae bacterium]|nr:hypothetical protein [Candidatus Peribacteraceae bacterium]